MHTARSGVGELVLYIVDTDTSVREALSRLATSAGFQSRPFASVEQFVAQFSANAKGCVLLDSSLLRGGKEAIATMRGRGIEWPVIVLCASVDEAARHEARVFGAHFLLNKPVDAQALFDAIAWVTDDEE